LLSTPPRLGVLLLCLFIAACGEAGEGDPSEPADPLLRPSQLAQTAPDRFQAEFETTAGDFVVTVERAWAPIGADRFYSLVQAGYYDDTRVHRVVPGFMAQFGIHGDPRVNQVWGRALIQDDPVGESNRRGRVAFAKAGPNSRTTEVFISLHDNVGLDEDGFAPFGEVTQGMEVVDALHDEYGDGPPRGDGPYAAMARARGNEYLDEEFPDLTRIVTARVIDTDVP
jgi:peptidyl-prolyl cis-trans isomerase A (cyclophilin A)